MRPSVSSDCTNLLCFSRSFRVCSFRTFTYYTWQELLDLGLQNLICFISNLWLIPEIWRTPDASQAAPSTGSARRQHRDHKQRQGKCGQLTAKLRLTPCRISLPSILLANMQPLVNKMDELQLWITDNRTLVNCNVVLSHVHVRSAHNCSTTITLALHRAVCWAHSSITFSPMTADLGMDLTHSSVVQITWQWLVSSVTMMSLATLKR